MDVKVPMHQKEVNFQSIAMNPSCARKHTGRQIRLSRKICDGTAITKPRIEFATLIDITRNTLDISYPRRS